MHDLVLATDRIIVIIGTIYGRNNNNIIPS